MFSSSRFVVVMSILFFVTASAQADYVTVYDFDHLTGGVWPGTTLNGQDGWTHAGINANTATAYGSPDVSGYMSSKNREMLYRDNDATWSYSIPGGNPFKMEYNIRIGNETGSGWNRGTEVGVRQSSDGAVPFKIGFDGWGSNKWRVRTAAGDAYLSDNVAATSQSEFWNIMLDVDPLGYGGQGSADFYAEEVGSTTGYLPVAGLQDINLHLLDSGTADTTLWNSLWVDIQNGAQFDDITFATTPEPSDLMLAFLGFVGISVCAAKERIALLKQK